jgi:hypothetical protein
VTPIPRLILRAATGGQFAMNADGSMGVVQQGFFRDRDGQVGPTTETVGSACPDGFRRKNRYHVEASLRDIAAKVSVIMLTTIIGWLVPWCIDRTSEPVNRAG